LSTVVGGHITKP